MASASQSKNGYYLTINTNGLEKKSLSQLVGFFEHEITHLIQLTGGISGKSIEDEYLAWSAEFELLERVYGDLNPYKAYIKWKEMTKEEFIQYLREEDNYYATYEE